MRNVASSSLFLALIVANRFVRSSTTHSDGSFIIASRDVEMRQRRSSYARRRIPGVPGSFRITDRNYSAFCTAVLSPSFAPLHSLCKVIVSGAKVSRIGLVGTPIGSASLKFGFVVVSEVESKTGVVIGFL